MSDAPEDKLLRLAKSPEDATKLREFDDRMSVPLVLAALLPIVLMPGQNAQEWVVGIVVIAVGELGHRVNRKRVQRLWREEGLRVPARRRKRRRRRDSTVPASRLRAERPDHVWALDFQFDQTANGRVIKLLNVVDEFTREALAIHVARRNRRGTFKPRRHCIERHVLAPRVTEVHS